jgi:hypothetical protein
VADRIRLYFDEHVPLAVFRALRRRGIDVVRAQDVGLHPAEDEEHLAYATREGRVVMTQDADFLRLHAAGSQHRGIAYAPQQTPVRYLIQMLTLLVDVVTPEQMVNHVEYL